MEADEPKQLDQNSVGVLTLDPTDKKHDTIYLGTGEANRCGSGCEAGVGIYRSKTAASTGTSSRRVREQRHVRVREPR